MPTSGRMLRRGVRTIAAVVRLHPGVFTLAVVGAMVYAGATVASAIVLGRLTDDVIVPAFDEGHVDDGTVMGALVAVVIVGLVKASGIVVRRVSATVTGARVGATLRTKVVRRLQAVPYRYHQRTPTGELLANAGTDVDAVVEPLFAVPYATAGLSILVIATVTAFVVDPWLALVAVIVFPSLLVLNLVYTRRVEEPVAQAQAHLGRVSAVAHESFEAALVVKVLGGEEIEGERFGSAAGALRDAKIRVARLRATFESILEALPALGTCALVVVGAMRIDSGEATVGNVVTFISLFTILVWPVRLVGYVLGELPRGVAGYDRIERVLAEPPDPRHAVADWRMSTLVGGDSDARPPRFETAGAAVQVEGVSFGYEPGLEVLHDVRLRLAPGRTLALVGATGSGKSTLLLLLAGLIEPDAGSIRVDGRELHRYDVQSLRDSVALVFQDAFLFGDSLRENVLLGDPAPDDDLPAVAAAAGVDEFLTQLPAGWETLVGERGATLSGGQRQRVALARALVRRPRLLLLDDATSAVDPTMEAVILASLRQRGAGSTTVMVAHRPSTIALADEVAYLEDGRVLDQGRHDEVLARQPGYARLVLAYVNDRERVAP